jgi:hypothetical protein
MNDDVEVDAEEHDSGEPATTTTRTSGLAWHEPGGRPCRACHVVVVFRYDTARKNGRHVVLRRHGWHGGTSLHGTKLSSCLIGPGHFVGGHV